MNDIEEKNSLKKTAPNALPIWKIVLHFCWGFTIGFFIGG